MYLSNFFFFFFMWKVWDSSTIKNLKQEKSANNTLIKRAIPHPPTKKKKDRKSYEPMSTDTARKLPHRSPMRPNMGCGIWRGCPRDGAAFELFFFFFSSQIHSNLAWFAPIFTEPSRFAQNRAILAKLGHIGRLPKWSKQTKTVEISRNRSWIMLK